MTMSITVATDLTARSDRPVDRAVQLARQLNARLVLVHALEAKDGLGRREQTARARRELERMSISPEVSVESVLEVGSAPELVAQVALEHDSACIVVGAARYNDVSDFFLGTAVDYLVRRASVPVLVVKQKPIAPYDGLVIGTDFSDRSKDALLVAMALFDTLPATLVHAFGRPFSGRIDAETSLELCTQWSHEAMEKFLAQPDIAPLRRRITSCCIESGAAGAIAAESERYHHPLAVLGAHGWGRVAQTLLGSRASELLAQIPNDILIVRQSAS